MTRFRCLILALLALGLPATASTIVPPLPAAQQAVDLRLTVDSCTFNPASVVVSASGTTLRVVQRLNNCFAPGTPGVYDVRLGNFPVGDYRVEVYNTAPASGTPAETLSFRVASAAELDINLPPQRPLTNYSGFWWQPEASGWGMSLAQAPGSESLFGAIYMYNGASQPAWQPTWVSLQGGSWVTPTFWQGSYIQTIGPVGHVTTFTFGLAQLDFGTVPTSGRVKLRLVSMDLSENTTTLVRFNP